MRNEVSKRLSFAPHMNKAMKTVISFEIVLSASRIGYSVSAGDSRLVYKFDIYRHRTRANSRWMI